MTPSRHVGHVLVIGGGGQIGRALANEFAGVGWRVTSIVRREHGVLRERSPGVRYVVGDRKDRRLLTDALGDSANAVIDLTSYDAEDAVQLLELASMTDHLVVVSSASVYADEENRSLDDHDRGFPEIPAPIPETHRTVSAGDETYSQKKIAIEQRLLHQDVVSATVLRPCAVWGIGSRHAREWWVLKRLLDGRDVIPLAYGGRSVFHQSAAPNIARVARIAVLERYHGVLNVGDDDPLSVLEITREIARTSGRPLRALLIDDGDHHEAVGMTPWSVPRPFVLDTSRAKSLGFHAATSFRESASAYCAWMTQAAADGWAAAFPQLAAYPPSDLFDYAEEDRFFARDGSSVEIDLVPS